MESEELKDFLLNLDDKSREELQELMNEMSMNKTKATRHAIVWYRNTRDRANRQEERAIKAENEIRDLKAKLKNFIHAQKELEKSI